MNDEYQVTEELALKVLTTVNAGLTGGLGRPVPGQMCVEAAVCYAMGLPHSDRPTCVGEAVRRFKIRLNDSRWSSDAARASGMRKLAIAQLGSDTIDQKAFAKIVIEKSIRRIVPMAMRSAASVNPKYADELEAAAKRCEVEGTGESAKEARAVARKAAAAAADAAAAAAYAADAAAYAAAGGDAADAADAAAYAAYAAGAKKSSDEVLNLCADIGLQALIELKSPGAAFLYLVEDQA